MSKCGSFHPLRYLRWKKKNNKWTFSLIVAGKERWTNAENEDKREKKLKGLQEAIDSIESQFMTLSYADRKEDREPYEKAIDEVYDNYEI